MAHEKSVLFEGIVKHSLPGAIVGGTLGAALSFGKNAVVDGDINHLFTVDLTLLLFIALGALIGGGIGGLKGIANEKRAFDGEVSQWRVPRDDGPGGSD